MILFQKIFILDNFLHACKNKIIVYQGYTIIFGESHLLESLKILQVLQVCESN